jgi:2-oxoglutarate/2-oxoacid ferredoxin oxidoreductase subunit beta
MTFLASMKQPYCPGCGYHLVTSQIAKALEKLNLAPRDVVISSDIGCGGLIDASFTAHTIHGLHGRSVALGMGAALGLEGKKVIAFQGDGGATIGLQHLLEAARWNVDMTLVIVNNMIYGMTGGQPSGLTPFGFTTAITPQGHQQHPYDLVKLAFDAGATYALRIMAKGDFSDKLAVAFAVKGFSVVEIVSPCPSYGVKGVKDLAEMNIAELELKREREPMKPAMRESKSLIKTELERLYEAGLKDRIAVVLSGSAGEGVQSAAELLAEAAILSGLKTTKKGDYPITVGTGFSLAEVILSEKKIDYTGIQKPDVIVVTSDDGLARIKALLKPGDPTLIVADSSLTIEGMANVVRRDFRGVAGKKGACLAAIGFWLRRSSVIPEAALREATKKSKHAESLLKSIASTESLEA